MSEMLAPELAGLDRQNGAMLGGQSIQYRPVLSV